MKLLFYVYICAYIVCIHTHICIYIQMYSYTFIYTQWEFQVAWIWRLTVNRPIQSAPCLRSFHWLARKKNQTGSTEVDGIDDQSNQIKSNQMNSIQFNSIPFKSIQIKSIIFKLIVRKIWIQIFVFWNMTSTHVR